MLLVATHTKTCQQTGEYILLVKRGLDLVVSERRNERSTDFSLYNSDANSATCRRKCSQNPGRVGRLRRSLTCQMWIHEVIGVG